MVVNDLGSLIVELEVLESGGIQARVKAPIPEVIPYGQIVAIIRLGAMLADNDIAIVSDQKLP